MGADCTTDSPVSFLGALSWGKIVVAAGVDGAVTRASGLPALARFDRLDFRNLGTSITIYYSITISICTLRAVKAHSRIILQW